MFCRSIVTLGMVVAFGVGCASHQTGGSDPDVITYEQIARSKASNAYDLIATIRPQMFTAHGAATTRGSQPSTEGRQALPVVVYVDNARVGFITELKGMGTADVREIRYLSPRVATDRWGINHAGGVIHVTTAQGLGIDTTLR